MIQVAKQGSKLRKLGGRPVLTRRDMKVSRKKKGFRLQSVW